MGKDLEVCKPPASWAGRIARFDYSIFGRDSWAESVWVEMLTSPDCAFLAVLGERDPLRSLPPIEAIAGIRFADDAELLTVAVASWRRRQGIARGLLSQLVAQACAWGCSRIFLEVRASDAGAQALYESFGFMEVGRRRHYYHDDDAVVMAVELAREYK